LDLYTDEEKVQVKCEKCNKNNNNITKKYEISRTTNYIIFNLQRIKWTLKYDNIIEKNNFYLNKISKKN